MHDEKPKEQKMSRVTRNGLSPRKAARILKNMEPRCAYSETAVGDWYRARVSVGVKFSDNYDVARSVLAFWRKHGAISVQLAKKFDLPILAGTGVAQLPPKKYHARLREAHGLFTLTFEF